MYNKVFLIVCIALIFIATRLPRYFYHSKIYGRILETKLLEKVEQIPVKRVTINTDNVSSTVNTNKNFTRYRLYIRYQYYVNGKREIGEHKYGDYPGYLTELELVNVKSRYYKGAQIPIFVSNYNSKSATLIQPTNWPRICLATIGLTLIYGQIFAALFKMRGRLLQEGVIKAKPY
jgi:hypothetical protein